MTPKSTAQERIVTVIRDWLLKLQEYPDWREWKRSHIVYTLNFDDELLSRETSIGVSDVSAYGSK